MRTTYPENSFLDKLKSWILKLLCIDMILDQKVLQTARTTHQFARRVFAYSNLYVLEFNMIGPV
jgi:hypothetical protein